MHAKFYYFESSKLFLNAVKLASCLNIGIPLMYFLYIGKFLVLTDDIRKSKTGKCSLTVNNTNGEDERKTIDLPSVPFTSPLPSITQKPLLTTTHKRTPSTTHKLTDMEIILIAFLVVFVCLIPFFVCYIYKIKANSHNIVINNSPNVIDSSEDGASIVNLHCPSVTKNVGGDNISDLSEDLETDGIVSNGASAISKPVQAEDDDDKPAILDHNIV